MENLTRKELAEKLAEIVIKRNSLRISVKALAKTYLKGAGYARPMSKSELIKAVEAFN